MNKSSMILGEIEEFIINEALDRLLDDMKKDPDNVRFEFDKMIENCTDYMVPSSWVDFIERTKNKFNFIREERDRICSDSLPVAEKDDDFLKELYSM